VLDQIGFRITLVDGGYKAFRAALVADLPQLAARFHYQVVCGPTGSGKTRLLQALAAEGAQVLDLEALANHRSSVLGAIPGVEQPSQKLLTAASGPPCAALTRPGLSTLKVKVKKSATWRCPKA
jgi:tRNA 2-selenouridine synthase